MILRGLLGIILGSVLGLLLNLGMKKIGATTGGT